jgi:hypothetical protein
MLTIVGGGCLAVVVLAVVAFFLVEAQGKKRAEEALAARGRELGTWTVYYDVKANRIGLTGTISERDLLRYALFRVHDLFDYNQGLEGERRRIGEAIISAARNLEGEKWDFLFQPPKSELFHASESKDATLFKYFEGKLYENAIDKPRFLGGDAMAKQKGLLGECIALIQYFAKDPQRGVNICSGVVRMVEKELRDGPPGQGARFWNLPNETLKEIAGPQG